MFVLKYRAVENSRMSLQQAKHPSQVQIPAQEHLGEVAKMKRLAQSRFLFSINQLESCEAP